jgi:hypothetical protein
MKSRNSWPMSVKGMQKTPSRRSAMACRIVPANINKWK